MKDSRRMRRAAGAAAGVLVLLAACGGDAGDTAAAGDERFSIEPEPRLSVGVLVGDTLQEFHRVVTPFLMADGRLVVPLAGASTIRVFDATGAFVTNLGRAGEGPGEFRYLTFAWPRGDTIEAFDFMLQRITRFLPDGKVETVTLDTELPDLSAVAGPMGEGWVVGGVASGGYGQRDVLAFHRFGRDGADLGEIARVQGFERYASPGLGGGPTPLSPNAVRRVSGERLYVGETLTPVLRVVGADGGTVTVTLPLAPAAAPVADVLRAVIDTALARAPAEQVANVRRRLETAPMAEQLSLYWALIVDDDGLLWIRPYEPIRHAAALGGLSQSGGGPGGEWIVYSADGVALGTARMPADLEPAMITRDAIVGIARDELGVESVRVHTLHRR